MKIGAALRVTRRFVMDSRDGRRRGLPWEAALDLMFLEELSVSKRAIAASEKTGLPFKQMYAHCLGEARSSAEDAWSDPVANREVVRMGRVQSRSKPAPVHDTRPTPQKKAWWRRLLG